MTEADFIHVITQNRQVYGLYSVGYGLLSITALLAAYLLRNTPLWFRSLAAGITVFKFSSLIPVSWQSMLVSSNDDRIIQSRRLGRSSNDQRCYDCRWRNSRRAL